MNGIISIVRTNNSHHAEVAELADALDSKSSAYKRAGSSPAFGTIERLRLPAIFAGSLFSQLFSSMP